MDTSKFTHYVEPTITNPNKCCLDKPTDIKINEESLVGLDFLNPPREWPQFRWGDPAMLSLIPRDQMVKEKYPRVRALRKLIGELVGPIVGESCNVKFFIPLDNGFAATCEALIKVRVTNPYFLGGDLVGETVCSAAAADATPFNMHEDFSTFATANADTRAKGRAYVGLLGLNINVAEELPSEDVVKTSKSTGDPLCTNVERQGMTGVLRKLNEKHSIVLDPELVAKYLGYTFNTLTQSQVTSINSNVQKWISSPKTLPKELYSK